MVAALMQLKSLMGNKGFILIYLALPTRFLPFDFGL